MVLWAGWLWRKQKFIYITYSVVTQARTPFKTDMESSLLFLIVLYFSSASARSYNICSLPLETGRCKAYIPSWGSKDGECVRFIYGGCGGNSNRFKYVFKSLFFCANSIIVLKKGSASRLVGQTISAWVSNASYVHH